MRLLEAWLFTREQEGYCREDRGKGKRHRQKQHCSVRNCRGLLNLLHYANTTARDHGCGAGYGGKLGALASARANGVEHQGYEHKRDAYGGEGGEAVVPEQHARKRGYNKAE